MQQHDSAYGRTLIVCRLPYAYGAIMGLKVEQIADAERRWREMDMEARTKDVAHLLPLEHQAQQCTADVERHLAALARLEAACCASERMAMAGKLDAASASHKHDDNAPPPP